MNKLYNRKIASLIVSLAAAVSMLVFTALPASAEPFKAPLYNDILQWELPMVNADKAYVSNSRGQGIKVAVIDSGVSAHEELKTVKKGYNYLDGNTDTSDSFGHGTEVTGIIAAQGSEILGVAPDAEIIPLKCFVGKSASVSNVCKAIKEAVDKYSCDVINLSFGMSTDNEELRSAVSYALSKGTVVVAAAGNDGSSTKFYPASYSGVISVNSVDEKRNISSFSQKNNAISLSAPGQDIYTTGCSGDYVYCSGTSFAAPYVSGAAAVLLSMDRSLAPSQIKDLLCRTAVDRGVKGYDSSYGYGILNIGGAVSEVMGSNPFWISQLKDEGGAVSCVVYNNSSDKNGGTCSLDSQSQSFSCDPGCAEKLTFSRKTGYQQCNVYIGGATDGSVKIRRMPDSNTQYIGIGVSDSSKKFRDVSRKSWYLEEVSVSVYRGTMNGTSSTMFSPSSKVTRAMMVTVLYRLNGSPKVSAKINYGDVPKGTWYTDAVIWADSKGIVNGVAPKVFAPDSNVTREQMSAMIYRFDKYLAYNMSFSADRIKSFTDGGKVDTYARNPMNYCLDRGIVRGMSSTVLNPDGNLTRAELAAVLSRL